MVLTSHEYQLLFKAKFCSPHPTTGENLKLPLRNYDPVGTPDLMWPKSQSLRQPPEKCKHLEWFQQVSTTTLLTNIILNVTQVYMVVVVILHLSPAHLLLCV